MNGGKNHLPPLQKSQRADFLGDHQAVSDITVPRLCVQTEASRSLAHMGEAMFNRDAASGDISDLDGQDEDEADLSDDSSDGDDEVSAGMSWRFLSFSFIVKVART